MSVLSINGLGEALCVFQRRENLAKERSHGYLVRPARLVLPEKLIASKSQAITGNQASKLSSRIRGDGTIEFPRDLRCN